MTGKAQSKNIVKAVAFVALCDAVATTGLYFLRYRRNDTPAFLEVVIWLLHGALFFSFLFLARRDLLLLFIRPTKTLGTGFSRVWAVARTTTLEAWAGRIWLLPLLWLACAMILILAVVPFDESERIPLYIRTLLGSQQVLVLVMMWVMACVSLPREREKKILISTSSKPLSRLEILLGKFIGFGMATGFVMLFMYVASMVILQVSDLRLRARAAENFQLQTTDFAKDKLVAPSQELKQLSETGSLYAYNYITVPPNGMSILGGFRLDPATGQPIREVLGGTNEKISYRFTPFLPAAVKSIVADKGRRPYFEFNFPLSGNTNQPIRLNVSAYSSQKGRVAPPRPQERTITLNAAGDGRWEPDDPQDLFTPIAPSGELVNDPKSGVPLNLGEVTLEVTCITPDVFLRIHEQGPNPSGGAPESNVKLRVDRDNPDFAYLPNPNPIVRGFERRERQEISGPKINNRFAELVLYHFPADSLNDIPVDSKGNFTITLEAETYKSGNPDAVTRANIDVVSTDRTAGDMFSIRDQEILEKRPMQISVPKRLLGTDAAHRGDLYVRMYSTTLEHSISVLENSIRIELPRTPFFVNFFKGELIIYFEVLLLIAIAITCSVRVGWAVAMFLSGGCVAFGLLVDFIASLPEYGGLGALNYHAGAGSPDAIFKFFDSAASGLWHILGFISSIVPNFTLFDPAAYVGNLQNTPWSVIWNNGFSAVTYLVPFLALSYLMFRKQELG